MSVLESGVVTLCTQYAERPNVESTVVHEGLQIAGAALIVEELLVDGVQGLVY